MKHMSLASVNAMPIRAPWEMQGVGCSLHSNANHLDAVLAAFLRITSDNVCVMELNGTVVWTNTLPSAPARRGYNPATGSAWERAWPAEHQLKIHTALRTAAHEGQASFAAYTRTAGGSKRFWDVTLARIFLPVAASRFLVATVRQVQESKLSTHDCCSASSVDGLTGLPSTTAFHKELSARTTADADLCRPFALAMLNLDGFKRLNSRAGPQKCDELLAQFADFMIQLAGGAGFFARSGGDEFALICDEPRGAAELRRSVAAMVQQCAEQVSAANPSAKFTVSAGIAMFPTDASTDRDLLTFAQTALRTAKRQGRGKCVLFDGNMRQQLQRHSAMLELARAAIADDRVRPYYQPKVDLRTGKVIGLEALLRWESSGGAVHLPATISAAFDDPEIALQIGNVMLKKVIADLKQWKRAGLLLPVALNVSSADLKNPHFARYLLHSFSEADLPTSLVEIEVTEGVFFDSDDDNVGATLRTLNAAGVRIALDDFGTGYAALTHLKNYPIDVIKIDQSFVKNMTSDPDDRAIVSAIVSLSRDLALDVVAEGIESATQAALLSDLGCCSGQGFLFSEAVLGSEVMEAVRCIEAAALGGNGDQNPPTEVSHATV